MIKFTAILDQQDNINYGLDIDNGLIGYEDLGFELDTIDDTIDWEVDDL